MNLITFSSMKKYEINYIFFNWILKNEINNIFFNKISKNMKLIKKKFNKNFKKRNELHFLQ